MKAPASSHLHLCLIIISQILSFQGRVPARKSFGFDLGIYGVPAVGGHDTIWQWRRRNDELNVAIQHKLKCSHCMLPKADRMLVLHPVWLRLIMGSQEHATVFTLHGAAMIESRKHLCVLCASPSILTKWEQSSCCCLVIPINHLCGSKISERTHIVAFIVYINRRLALRLCENAALRAYIRAHGTPGRRSFLRHSAGPLKMQQRHRCYAPEWNHVTKQRDLLPV